MSFTVGNVNWSVLNEFAIPIRLRSQGPGYRRRHAYAAD
jgi:hypothetical protein